jgi:hypothetical protein
MSERRGAARKKSFLRGCIYFNKRRSAIDCLIRDISDQGARLTFSDTVSVPDVVELYIPQKEQTLRARVQWRHGDEVGVAFGAAGFSHQANNTADVGILVTRVERLETELASLRQMLKRLRAEIAADAESEPI